MAIHPQLPHKLPHVVVMRLVACVFAVVLI